MMYPDSPRVGIGSVVLEGDRILLVRRLNEPGRGKYSVPGGHLKLGESIYDAAVRELREETGLDSRPLGIINIDEYVEYESGVIRFHYVLIDVLLEALTPLRHAKPSSDVDDVKVMELGEALKLRLTRSTRSLIEKIMGGGLRLIESNFIVSRIDR